MSNTTESPAVNRGVSPDSRLFAAIARCMLKWEIRSKQAWETYMARGGVAADLPIREWSGPLKTWMRAHDRQRHLLAAAMGHEVEGVQASTVIALGPRAAARQGRRAA
jgi:hypothetical protein